MNRLSFKFLAALLLLVLLTPAAFAQATRTWVSGVGDDANPCSRTAPCKTWAGAISKTVASGEIDALDPGGFGALTITKAITIDGGGGIVASALTSGTNGFVVSAGVSDTVILRNLSFNGLGSSLSGVNYVAGGQLVVEHCNIIGFSTGINMALTGALNGSLVVRDTTITGFIASGAATGTGVNLSSSTTTAFASISTSSFRTLATGLNAQTGAVADISNSTIQFVSNAALLANGGIISAESNMLSNNTGTAVLPTAGVIRLSNNDLFNNGLGVGTGTGMVGSAGNNRKAGNGTGSTTPTITVF